MYRLVLSEGTLSITQSKGLILEMRKSRPSLEKMTSQGGTRYDRRRQVLAVNHLTPNAHTSTKMHSSSKWLGSKIIYRGHNSPCYTSHLYKGGFRVEEWGSKSMGLWRASVGKGNPGFPGFLRDVVQTGLKMFLTFEVKMSR